MTQGTPPDCLFQSPLSETGTTDRSLEVYSELRKKDGRFRVEHRQWEIGLEFVHWSSDERKNFSEGSSKPKKDVQVILSVVGHEFLNLNYLFRISLPIYYSNIQQQSSKTVQTRLPPLKMVWAEPCRYNTSYKIDYKFWL